LELVHTEAHRSGCSFRASNPTGAEATPPYTLYTTRARARAHTHTHTYSHTDLTRYWPIWHTWGPQGLPTGRLLQVSLRVQGISGCRSGCRVSQEVTSGSVHQACSIYFTHPDHPEQP